MAEAVLPWKEVVLWNQPDQSSFWTSHSINLLSRARCISSECRIEFSTEADRIAMNRNCKLFPAVTVFRHKGRSDISDIRKQHPISLPELPGQESECAS